MSIATIDMEQLELSRPLYLVSNKIEQSIKKNRFFLFFFCSWWLCQLLFAIYHHVDCKIAVNLAIDHTIDQPTNNPRTYPWWCDVFGSGATLLLVDVMRCVGRQPKIFVCENFSFFYRMSLPFSCSPEQLWTPQSCKLWWSLWASCRILPWWSLKLIIYLLTSKKCLHCGKWSNCEKMGWWVLSKDETRPLPRWWTNLMTINTHVCCKLLGVGTKLLGLGHVGCEQAYGWSCPTRTTIIKAQTY